MWSAHPRVITDEQFTDGTTIDGSRLQKALKDMETRFNNIPRGDLSTQWLPTQFIAGWSPQRPDLPRYHTWPWHRSLNFEQDILIDAGDIDNVTNRHREKGYRVPGIDPDFIEPGLQLAETQLIWDQTFFFSDPVILVDWTLFLITDSTQVLNRYYTNDWTFTGPDTPDGFSIGDLTKDLILNISVDSDLDREDRSLADIVVKRSKFTVALQTVSQIDWPAAGWPDMSTPYPGGPPHGIVVTMPLYVPIHQRSRVRMSIVIPRYRPLVGSGWTVNPYTNQVVNNCLTVLEPLSV